MLAVERRRCYDFRIRIYDFNVARSKNSKTSILLPVVFHLCVVLGRESLSGSDLGMGVDPDNP